MIVQPGADMFHGASLLALASAAFYAVYQITTRMLAGEDPRVTLFYPALVGAAIMTLVWPWFGSRDRHRWTDVALMVDASACSARSATSCSSSRSSARRRPR